MRHGCHSAGKHQAGVEAACTCDITATAASQRLPLLSTHITTHINITMPRPSSEPVGSGGNGGDQPSNPSPSKRRNTGPARPGGQKRRRRHYPPQPPFQPWEILTYPNVGAAALLVPSIAHTLTHLFSTGHQHNRQRRNRLHLLPRPPQNAAARSRRRPHGSHGSDVG